MLDKIFFPLVYLLNRNLFMPFNRLLYLFALRLLGIGVSWQSSDRININESKFLASVKDQLGDGIVFDVGASVGHFAKAVRKHYPRARIICFEPHPIAYSKLHSNLHVEAYNVALSSRSGRAILYERFGTSLSTVASLEEKTLDMFGGVGHEYEVDVTTIDEMCTRLEIGHISLLKIDTEGFDFHVLQGARDMIRQGSIDIIEFEFVPACIQTKVHMKDFFDILEDYGIYRLALNGGLIPLRPYDYRFCEIFATQHLIAIRLKEGEGKRTIEAQASAATL